ncbi:uncharacterized protein Z518_07665 [Rhinocladiella mackenziei CBS 650.93]|uniref:Glutamyl-tRNA amidotransferase complex subunit Gta3 domain-containing protein n=1 Tax=Rhinocladiella mackenziei CBS 650.93 TaxID=1442369 RepID=A0A0D2FPJ5_9EURO|nr:uncharacterized protein Z518_07665 [Rhinocladiella mackenziei CBS 650.93]KIX04112.1 hypothetical protein Z518_07665 [Rhinocladiella mackenziei CBS 650.93]
MPRTARVSIRPFLVGPVSSPDREHRMKIVKSIKIHPQIHSLLEKPSWSVSSLLPPRESTTTTEPAVTREQLNHLLHLSGLPPPKDQREEVNMLSTLSQQIHFVKEIQKVDTTGIKPLVAIRDETNEAIAEQTITRAKLDQFFAAELKRGKNGTIRRAKDNYMVISSTDQLDPREENSINDRLEDPFHLGENEESRRMGRYFFIKREKRKEIDEQEEVDTER